MSKNKLIVIGFGVITCVIFINCNKKDTTTVPPITHQSTTPTLPAATLNYNVAYPAHVLTALTLQDNTPAANAITNDGATLGRVLFYDKKLSKNNTISCGSCHQPTLGFNDTAILSKGFAGALTTRHGMSLLNVRFYQSGKMFWDERSPSLENQVLQPIQNTTEMGLTLAEMEAAVNAQAYYPPLFQKAFGTSVINSDRIARALAQFVRSIVTYQARYDRVKQGIETFTPDEAAGEQLFITAPPGGGRACNNCHTAPMFITSNPGAPFALQDANDLGINNQNRFKSGSLRNIATAARLFHNGSVPGVQAMLNGNIPAHGVPPPDRAKMLAFLQTLTDNTIATEARFSNPFK